MQKRISLTLALICLPLVGATLSNAAVTVNLTSLALLNDAGGTPLPMDRPLFLVADSAGDGFGAVSSGTYGIGDFIGGNDQVVSIFDFATGAAAFSSPGAAEHAVTFDQAMFGGSGISLAVMWFDTPHVGTDRMTSVGSGITVTLASGTDGNIYNPNGTRGDAGAVDGSAAWLIPAEGSTVGLNFLTESTGVGTQISSLGNSIQNFVIPEPSSMLSMLLGMGVVLLRRRR